MPARQVPFGGAARRGRRAGSGPLSFDRTAKRLLVATPTDSPIARNRLPRAADFYKLSVVEVALDPGLRDR